MNIRKKNFHRSEKNKIFDDFGEILVKNVKNLKNGIFDGQKKNFFSWGARYFISLFDVILSEKFEYEQKKALSDGENINF